MTRILVVDDNELARSSFVDLLKGRGYAVDQAENGEQALEALGQFEYQLAVVDIMMPAMGGLELQQTLLHTKPDLKVILVTGQPETVRTLLEDDVTFQSGKVNVLYKPVHPILLLEHVAKCLDAEKPD